MGTILDKWRDTFAQLQDQCATLPGEVDDFDEAMRADKATELLSLAVKMREAQKEYFKTRSHDALNDSKRLEREFDKAVDAYFNPPTPDLFDAHLATHQRARPGL